MKTLVNPYHTAPPTSARLSQKFRRNRSKCDTRVRIPGYGGGGSGSDYSGSPNGGTGGKRGPNCSFASLALRFFVPIKEFVKVDSS